MKMYRLLSNYNLMRIYISLLIIGIASVNAYGSDPTELKVIDNVSLSIIESASSFLTKYDITVEKVKDENRLNYIKTKYGIKDDIYVVRYDPRVPPEVIMAGGGYSIYFKKDKDKDKFVLVIGIVEQ